MKKSHSRGQHSSYSQALQVDGGDSDILHSHTHTLTHMHLDMADTHNCVHSSSASSELMEEGMGLDREVEDSEAHEQGVVRVIEEAVLQRQRQRQGQRPPPGHWRDGICSWANNLWPSCACSFFFFCGGWIAGQIAQASGYQAFQSFVIPYLVAFTVFGFIFIVTLNPLCLVLMWFIVFVYAIFLRLHFIKKHDLTERSWWRELLLGICCCPCSLAQMARHTFGYRLVFDGDSRPQPACYFPVSVSDHVRQQEMEMTEHATEILSHASHTV